jgi:deoxycytidylate deaminase
MCIKQNIVAYCYDKKGRLISTGVNSYNKTHPLQAHFAALANLDKKIYLHAEIDALLKAKGKVVHSIKVMRFNNKGKEMLAAPCPICQLAIKSFGVKSVTYTI